MEPAEVPASELSKERQRVSLRELHGIVFGSISRPTHVLVPGFPGSTPEELGAWLDGLCADGWEVAITPALSFEGVLVDARLVAPR